MISVRAAAFTIGIGLGAACLPYSVDRDPEVTIAVPESYGGEAALRDSLGAAHADASATAAPSRGADRAWWTDFGDAQLTALEERALAGNMQVRAAWARVAQARALAETQWAGRWPAFSAELSASRQRSVAQFGALGTMVLETDRFGASVAASYELDLFDRIGAGGEAADIDAEAARDDVAAASMTLAAQIADAWFDLVELRARRALLETQLQINDTYLELVTLRFQQGLTSGLDVHQQRQQVEATRAQITLLVGREDTLAHQLAILVGVPPRALVLEARDVFPDVPPPPEAGLPGSLVAQRPDVRAAKRRITAADLRVGAAITGHLPTLRATGSVGFGSTELATLFDEIVYTVQGAISIPIFEGGRRAAEVRRNQAIVDERVAQFAQATLQALTEVENALALERQARLQIAVVESQLQIATETLESARDRYRQGLSDFLPVLTALQALQQIELSLVTAKRQLLAARVQLYRALGGTWTDRLVPPAEEG